MKYGVITTRQIYHEGDERSRTNPGHGYPAYTETATDFREFETQDDLKRWLKSTTEKNYRVIEFQDIKVETEVVITLKKPGVTRSS
jgi:hypothetical protein